MGGKKGRKRGEKEGGKREKGLKILVCWAKKKEMEAKRLFCLKDFGKLFKLVLRRLSRLMEKYIHPTPVAQWNKHEPLF